MKQGLVRLLYNFGKRFMGWTLHMIMCVLLCYPVSIRIYYQQGGLFLVKPSDLSFQSKCTRSTLGGPEPICLSTSSHSGQWCPYMPLLWDLIDPSVPAQSAAPTFLSDSAQEYVEFKSPCLAPRTSAIEEQGFSEAVAARIDAS